MAVANETILIKMMQEIQQAKDSQHQQEKMLKHIEKIRLLCDLFLEEDRNEGLMESPKVNDITAAELKAMLGVDKSTGTGSAQTFKKSIDLDEEDGNGESIFDF
ncbi:YwdI family protein [Ornithinibacillus bavariensis]|uniref:YwdI family protein n=1 Tax=Ornithinibacillus bavariensis TaxID=545502 RepID=UPI000ED8D71A|nr:hypothetical protein [Ornithinibacillus sp.]